MKWPDAVADPVPDPAAPAALADLPDLPRNDDGPVFAEPWQASAFALAVSLSRAGHFTWKEWAGELAQELKASAARGEVADGTLYYHCWLTTLERLVVAKGLSDPAVLTSCKDAWAEAYRRTPHGKPVELAAAGEPRGGAPAAG